MIEVVRTEMVVVNGTSERVGREDDGKQHCSDPEIGDDLAKKRSRKLRDGQWDRCNRCDRDEDSKRDARSVRHLVCQGQVVINLSVIAGVCR